MNPSEFTLRANVLLPLALAACLLPAVAQDKPQVSEEARTPEPTAEEIFAKVEEHNRARETRLGDYTSRRIYRVLKSDRTLRSEMRVDMAFRSPSTKTFKVVSKDGSGWVHRFVFQRLMDAELDSSSGKEKRDSSISRANYTFELLGREQIEDRWCWILKATPNVKTKYLFVGKVWVDEAEFAVVRVTGEPAKRPSFWVRKTEIVREYHKVGDFWLPRKDHTVSDVLVMGRNILDIEYGEYHVNAGQAAPDPSSKF